MENTIPVCILLFLLLMSAIKDIVDDFLDNRKVKGTLSVFRTVNTVIFGIIIIISHREINLYPGEKEIILLLVGVLCMISVILIEVSTHIKWVRAHVTKNDIISANISIVVGYFLGVYCITALF